MTNKFEQLIEYVINDEEQKARELFHDIVVEKSREIYESLMEEEDEESSAERDDKAEKAGKKVAKDIEYDEKKNKLDEDEEEDDEEDLEEDMTSDAAPDLIDDVEMDEEGMTMENDAEFDDEAEEEGEEMTHDMENDHDEEGDIEDRVVDLEDKLDELMAEFEAIMGGEHGEEDEFDAERNDVGNHDMQGDELEMDDTAEFADMPLGENISLPSAPKPVTTEPAGTNTKSTTAFNSGAAGMASKPVGGSPDEKNPDGTAAYKKPSNAYSKGEGNLPGAGTFKNTPAKDGSKLAPAPKPVTAQAAGVNTKTPFPRG